jgi:hypothetical protein
MSNTYESNGVFSYTYLGNYINDVLNEGAGKTSTCNSSASAAPSSATAVVTGTYPCYTSMTAGIWTTNIRHHHHGLCLLWPG